ncbi:MAG: translocation/assembly module TamB, partial [Gemmatimonadota bacterium]|nr:translocation/assembly module TamB [Gemmatimonadota bacterium]
LGRQMAGLIVRDFRVTRGEVQYFGTPDLNARIDITAERNVTPERAASIRIFVNVGGTLHEPTVAFSSDAVPPLPEEELISYLVFNAPSIESFGAQQLLTQDLFGVFSDRISVEAERLIISNLGVPFDYIRARPLSEEGLVPTGVEFAVGIQIWPRAYLSFSPRICPSSSDIPLSRNTGVGVDYRMTRNWHLSVSQEPVNTCSATEAISSTARSQFGFDFFWEKRY